LQALAGQAKLTRHLRDTMDAQAQAGHWSEVMALASAPEDEAMRLLMGCRALVRGGTPSQAANALQFSALMQRWSAETGRPEWAELLNRILEDIADIATKGQR